MHGDSRKQIEYKKTDHLKLFGINAANITSIRRLNRNRHQELLYGPDIKEGIALTLILEMRNMRCSKLMSNFSNEDIQTLMNQLGLNFEAKIPNKIAMENMESHSKYISISSFDKL